MASSSQHDEEASAVNPLADAPRAAAPPPSTASAVHVAPEKTTAEHVDDIVNPFYYDAAAPSGVLQGLKMFLVGVTLFPLRVLTLMLSLLVAWFFCKLMLVGVTAEELSKKPLRRSVLRACFRGCARVFLWSLGYWWVSVSGDEHTSLSFEDAARKIVDAQLGCSDCSQQHDDITMDKQRRDELYRAVAAELRQSADGHSDRYYAPIIVANHTSLVDVVYLASSRPFMAVGKQELLSLPLLGTICSALQYIAVQRESADSRKAVSREICSRTKVDWVKVAQEQRMAAARSDSHNDNNHGDTATTSSSSPPPVAWQPLVIFPEATVTNTRSVIQFKLGAFAPGAPVQPMTLKYPYRNFMTAWVGTTSLGGSMLRSMLQVTNFLEVQYLPIHFPTALEVADAPRFAQAVREKIAAALGVPMTDHTFEDVQLINEAAVLQLPFLDNINVEMGKQSIGVERAKAKLRQFAMLDTDGDGFLTREEFTRFLESGSEGGGGQTAGATSCADGTGTAAVAARAAQVALRNAIFDRWLLLANRYHSRRKRQPTTAKGTTEGGKQNEAIDFAAFLACSAAQKVRLRLRERCNSGGMVLGSAEAAAPLSTHAPVATAASRQDRSESFYLEEANDEELLYCVTLCFGSFDKDHDGSVSRQEFREGMLLVCPSILSPDAGPVVGVAHPNTQAQRQQKQQAAELATPAPREAWGAGHEAENSAIAVDDRPSTTTTTTLPGSNQTDILDELFDEVDTDHNGVLVLDELLAFVRKRPLLLEHLLSAFDLQDTLEFGDV